MSLWQHYYNHRGRYVGKWAHYLPIYDKHFQTWKDKTIVFWEIGVADGGSLEMWRSYFGPNVLVIGIDNNPACKAHEIYGTQVRIGSQADTVFLQQVIDEFGVPDIVLDDGSHQQDHVKTTFEFLYPKMPKNGVYMVEDLHTAYWAEYKGGMKAGSFIDYTKDCLDKLNARHSRQSVPEDFITNQTLSITCYDSVVCFEKGQYYWNQTFTRGTPPGASPSP